MSDYERLLEAKVKIAKMMVACALIAGTAAVMLPCPIHTY